MRFDEAMKALEEGKKVRSVDWGSSFWIKVDACDSYHRMIDLTKSLVDSEWELYEEPEKLLSWTEVEEGLENGKYFLENGKYFKRNL